MSTAAANAPMSAEEKKVIFASSLGTVFEWYDFYLYGSLAAFIGKHFFAALDPTAQFIASLLAFAAGMPPRFGLLDYTRDLQIGVDVAYLAGFTLSWFVYINVLLAVFNLLPLAPLDGFKVVLGLLPPDLSREAERLERWAAWRDPWPVNGPAAAIGERLLADPVFASAAQPKAIIGPMFSDIVRVGLATIPRVLDCERKPGLPSAKTTLPGTSLSESPKFVTWRGAAPFLRWVRSSLSTARSVIGS